MEDKKKIHGDLRNVTLENIPNVVSDVFKQIPTFVKSEKFWLTTKGIMNCCEINSNCAELAQIGAVNIEKMKRIVLVKIIIRQIRFNLCVLSFL